MHSLEIASQSHRWRILGLTVFALALSAGPLAAQTAPRQGLWFGGGFALGWAHVSCDICQANRETDISVNLRFGITVSRSLLLGIEANGWRRAEEGVGEKLGTLGANLYWYPNPRRGLHMKGGFGVVGYRVDGEDGTITSTAFGPNFGLGYDIRLGRSLSLTPFLQANISIPSASLNFEGERVTDGVGLSLFQLGLVATWH